MSYAEQESDPMAITQNKDMRVHSSFINGSSEIKQGWGSKKKYHSLEQEVTDEIFIDLS